MKNEKRHPFEVLSEDISKQPKRNKRALIKSRLDYIFLIVTILAALYFSIESNCLAKKSLRLQQEQLKQEDPKK